MKVQANSVPQGAFHIAPHPQRPGHAIVRFFANAIPVESAEGASLWEYDEFVIIVPDSTALAQDIEGDLAQWLASAQSLDAGYAAEKEARASVQAELADMAELVIDLEIENALLEMGVHWDDL